MWYTRDLVKNKDGRKKGVSVCHWTGNTFCVLCCCWIPLNKIVQVIARNGRWNEICPGMTDLTRAVPHKYYTTKSCRVDNDVKTGMGLMRGSSGFLKFSWLFGGLYFVWWYYFGYDRVQFFMGCVQWSVWILLRSKFRSTWWASRGVQKLNCWFFCCWKGQMIKSSPRLSYWGGSCMIV